MHPEVNCPRNSKMKKNGIMVGQVVFIISYGSKQLKCFDQKTQELPGLLDLNVILSVPWINLP